MSTLTQVSTSGNRVSIVLPPNRRWPYVTGSGRYTEFQGARNAHSRPFSVISTQSSPVDSSPVELPGNLPAALKPEIELSRLSLQREAGLGPNEQDKVWQTTWQQNDLPDELSETQQKTPKLVQDVVMETFNQAKAVRASILEIAASQKDTQNALEVPLMSTGGLRRSTVRATHRHQGPKTASQVNARPSSSTETVDSSDSGTSSSSRISLESTTTVGSPAESPTSETPEAEKPVTPTGLLSPLSYFNADRESERPSRRYGFMRLLRGKEDKGKEVKRKLSPSPPVKEALQLAVAQISMTKECASCFDDVPDNDAINLACQHSYCRPCLSNLVTTAMQHENFWPPKCCLQDIPNELLEMKLSALELASYRLKAKEYSIPAGDRWYCAKPECGKWFVRGEPRAHDATVSCTHCNFDMCLFCRGASHPTGEKCTQDRGLEATLAAAELEGWRRCYSCHTMVELNTGCRHITCKCRAEFCYTCGARWRTCSCTEADQQRRREQLAARRAIVAQEEAEIRAAIEAVAEAERREREEAEAEEARLREIMEREERERAAKEEARLAEEMKRIEKLEAERLERINKFFASLRSAMEALHQVQQRAIYQRQKQARVTTQEELEVVVAEEATLEAQKGKVKWEKDEKLKATKEKHAKQVIETAKRHRVDQDKYFVAFTDDTDAETVDIIAQAQKLEEIIQEQESERTAIRISQARELCRVIARVKEQNAEYYLMKRGELQKRKEAAIQAVSMLERVEFSDRKWFEQLKGERMAMLMEEENRLVQSGADVPSPLKASERAIADRRRSVLVKEPMSKPTGLPQELVG